MEGRKRFPDRDLVMRVMEEQKEREKPGRVGGMGYMG